MEDYKGTDCDDSAPSCQQLREQEEKLRNLLAQLFLISQNDLWEASAAIHDRILQLLNIAHLSVSTYLKTAENTVQSTLDLSQLTELKEKIAASIEESQRLMLELSSPILKYFGLSSALETLAEEKRNQNKSRIVLEYNKSHFRIFEHLAQLSFSIISELIILSETHFELPEIRIKINCDSKSLQISIDCPLALKSIKQLASTKNILNMERQLPKDPNDKRLLKLALQKELWMIFGGKFLFSSINDREFKLRLEMPL
ncbi:MAG: hypothetical protein GYA55_11200 [SAR324 cluster bacterium]|uniref:Signal transduction histidine kinase subgroup 3 dimerisation and phosphoacceptor domain-containing protein n=1 Tax=SAR324 cluster bacterium TaxID=2024889 RepID=A0A7X9IK39_9DELT|nr:hypothetical protein [SAR324 cluster bacterium]